MCSAAWEGGAAAAASAENSLSSSCAQQGATRGKSSPGAPALHGVQKALKLAFHPSVSILLSLTLVMNCSSHLEPGCAVGLQWQWKRRGFLNVLLTGQTPALGWGRAAFLCRLEA